MGFLLGAFGKLAAGRRVRALQAQMMRIQSRARRATRDVADMSKMLDRQEKMALNQASLFANYSKYTAQQSLFGQFGDVLSKVGGSANGNTSGLSETENKRLYEYQQLQSNMSMMSEQAVAMQKQQIQDYFEMLRETQLEPLKDEEELLQTEKVSLESQLQIANNDYEACKKMEQADAKNLAPSYTAG